jgi:chemotaxis signal transduction protein
VEAFQPVPEGVLSNDTAKAFTGVVERDESLIILLDLEEALPRGVGVTAAVAAEETEGETDV